MIYFYILGILGSFAFTLCIPSFWWSVTWQDIFTILFSTDEQIQNYVRFTQITEALGLTKTNLRSWAFERLLISVGIGLALILFFTIMYCLLRKKKPAVTATTNKTNKQDDPRYQMFNKTKENKENEPRN